MSFTTPLGALQDNHLSGYNFYADDTQKICISFDRLSSDSSVQLLSAAFDEATAVMDCKPSITTLKNEFLLLGTPH